MKPQSWIDLGLAYLMTLIIAAPPITAPMETMISVCKLLSRNEAKTDEAVLSEAGSCQMCRTMSGDERPRP